MAKVKNLVGGAAGAQVINFVTSSRTKLTVITSPSCGNVILTHPFNVVQYIHVNVAGKLKNCDNVPHNMYHQQHFHCIIIASGTHSCWNITKCMVKINSHGFFMYSCYLSYPLPHPFHTTLWLWRYSSIHVQRTLHLQQTCSSASLMFEPSVDITGVSMSYTLSQVKCHGL